MAYAIIKADFGAQHVKEIRLKQRSVELDNGDCIPIVQKLEMLMKLQLSLPNGLI